MRNVRFKLNRKLKKLRLGSDENGMNCIVNDSKQISDSETMQLQIRVLKKMKLPARYGKPIRHHVFGTMTTESICLRCVINNHKLAKTHRRTEFIRRLVTEVDVTEVAERTVWRHEFLLSHKGHKLRPQATVELVEMGSKSVKIEVFLLQPFYQKVQQCKFHFPF